MTSEENRFVGRMATIGGVVGAAAMVLYIFLAFPLFESPNFLTHLLGLILFALIGGLGGAFAGLSLGMFTEYLRRMP